MFTLRAQVGIEESRGAIEVRKMSIGILEPAEAGTGQGWGEGGGGGWGDP